MKRRKKLIICVFAVYLFFMFLYLPANYAFGILLDGVTTPMGTFRCGSLHGTWYQGVGLGGRLGSLSLKDIHWQFRPWNLLIGSLSAAVSGQSEQGRVAAKISRGISTVSVNDLEGDLALAEFTPLMNQYGVYLSGNIIASLEEFAISKGRVRAVDGTLVWKDAAIVLPIKSKFGSFEIDFVTTADGVKGVLSDVGGPFKVEGGGLLANDGRYTVDVTLLARVPEAQKQIDGLAFLGKKRGDGGLQFSFAGELPLL